MMGHSNPLDIAHSIVMEVINEREPTLRIPLMVEVHSSTSTTVANVLLQPILTTR